MGNFLAIAGYTIRQHWRHRVYLSLILFGLVIVSSSLIVSSLAVIEQNRMLENIGLAGIEFLALLAALFLTVNLVIEEMENRSLYLIMSHPVERYQYLLGRYGGTLVSLWTGMIMMAMLHVGILFFFGGFNLAVYLTGLVCAMVKIAVVSALALLISLVTTSTASSLAFSAFFWILGHFSAELQFMAEKSQNILVVFSTSIVKYITPNFQYFNWRDVAGASLLPSAGWWSWLVVYTSAYILMALFLSTWVFSKREF